VGLEHEGARKGGGRRTEDKSRAYKRHAAWYARKAIADNRGQGDWPYGGDVYMDVEIYYGRKHPRPDPENVIAILQDAFTRVLWWDDRNVLGRPNYHWWPTKNADRIPPPLFENGKYKGGVCIHIRKL
jgi:Holliday junction resolvase RusA-like endonuclease